jgi:hypothetical protein
VVSAVRALDQQAKTMVQLKTELLEAAREISAAAEVPRAA